MPYLNFHGHTHSREYTNSQYVNCCVELHHYTPVDFEELKERHIKMVEKGIKNAKTYLQTSLGDKVVPT